MLAHRAHDFPEAAPTVGPPIVTRVLEKGAASASPDAAGLARLGQTVLHRVFEERLFDGCRGNHDLGRVAPADDAGKTRAAEGATTSRRCGARGPCRFHFAGLCVGGVDDERVSSHFAGAIVLVGIIRVKPESRWQNRRRHDGGGGGGVYKCLRNYGWGKLSLRKRKQNQLKLCVLSNA